MEFKNKTAIVTGAASGIGLLFCQEFVKLGGNVVMADVNGDSLTEKANEINAQYAGKATPMVCDVRDYEQVTKTCNTAAETQEVVDFIMYLASDKAACITGTNHIIDCGRLALPRP